MMKVPNILFKSKCKCPDLYYQKSKGGCSPYNKLFDGYKIKPLDEELKILHTDLSQVNTDKVVLDENGKIDGERNEHYLESFILHSDCIEDEIMLKRDSNHFHYTCNGLDEILCTYGCARCFPVNKLCVYEIDYNGVLQHCPRGAHLKNCEEMECNNMFKCYKYYCIPYR